MKRTSNLATFTFWPYWPLYHFFASVISSVSDFYSLKRHHTALELCLEFVDSSLFTKFASHDNLEVNILSRAVGTNINSSSMYRGGARV